MLVRIPIIKPTSPRLHNPDTYRKLKNNFRFIFALTATALAFPHPEVEILTQPKPGDEYVFVQTTSSGARPIARKDKHHTPEEQSFETSHKLPPSLTYILNQNNAEEEQYKLKSQKRQIRSALAPAPAGAIKLDVKKLLEKYKTELKTSTTTTTTTKAPKRTPSKRIKKDVAEITSPSPILTTGAAIQKHEDDDIPLLASSSEKQRSRIQIKKAPNGQEYEYEYVYYYYDEDEEDAKVSNAHDGPARTPAKAASKNREVIERTSATPEANEVVPASRVVIKDVN